MNGVQRPNYEIRVGMFTIIATILLLYGWSWLKSFSLLHPPQRFTVQFHDIAGMTKNATVNINGVRVGIVEDIELKAKGQVLVHPKITSETVRVPQGSRFTIQTLGLVGAKYMEVSLPEPVADQPPPPDLQPTDVVIGEDPVRIELIFNEIGTFARQIVQGMKGQQIGKNFGLAIQNINEISTKFNQNMDHFKDAAISIAKTSDQFHSVAVETKAAAGNANRFFAGGGASIQEVGALAKDMRKATQKVNQILDRPMSMSDLKEVAQKAKEASDQIAVAMQSLNSTLKDEGTRHDLLSALDKLNRSTEDIAKSVETFNNMAQDKELRADIKDAVGKAREAIDKANNMLNKPDFQSDLRETIVKVKTTAGNVDSAARQLQQVLNKRAPLLQMMFGRPGRLKEVPKAETPDAEIQNKEPKDSAPQLERIPATP